MKTLVSVLVLFSALAHAEVMVSVNRCGGDGPKPYEDITGKYSYSADLVETNGGVKEFLFWERNNTLVYRNKTNELRGVHLPRPGEFATQFGLMTKSDAPLSSLVDAKESLLVNEGVASLYDAKTHRWSQFGQDDGWQHLFWENSPASTMYKNVLYSARRSYGSQNTLEIYKYVVGTDKATLKCRINLSDEVNSRNEWQIAEGSAFPYVYLYKGNQVGYLNTALISKFDVRKCAAVETLLYDMLRSPLKKAYKFPNRNGMLFELDHPVENILWWTYDKGCTYYAAEGLKPYVLRDSVPTIALFSPDQGMSLVFLDSAQRAALVTGMPFEEIGQNDIKMSEKGDRMFIAGRLANQNSKWLFQLKLPSVPTSGGIPIPAKP